jgi:signal transduction histidine kinase
VVDVWTRALRNRTRADRVRSTMAMLTRAVRSVAAGAPIPSAPLGDGPGFSQLPLARVVGLLRYHFLARIRVSTDGLDAQAVVHVLSALEQLERRIRPAVSDDVTEELVRYGGAGLAVQVAHDMRSPLTSILFLVEAIRAGQSGPVTALQERQLGLVYSAAFGLSAMASDLVELARGGDRLVEQEPISFSVLEVLHAVRDIVEPIAEEKGLEIRLAPPIADARRGYPLALHRVLLNLTTNALKFTDSGHVVIAADELSPTRLEFRVSDTGSGIADEVREALIAAAGGRSDLPAPEQFSFTGLGLAICLRLVDTMGGQLAWESRQEGGSCFRFALDLPYAGQL